MNFFRKKKTKKRKIKAKGRPTKIKPKRKSISSNTFSLRRGRSLRYKSYSKGFDKKYKK
mgnify:FL=1|tara:strand:- start:67 stop:243 length:177 start_codon:yes stop_codon:yes gene_type:complete